jgi:periplasmic protein TonB
MGVDIRLPFFLSRSGLYRQNHPTAGNTKYMQMTPLRFLLLRLNPFLLSLGIHSVALAAVIYTASSPGLRLASMGDLSIELVGVNGGQGGQSIQESTQSIQKGVKVLPVAQAKIRPQEEHGPRKIDEFSLKKSPATNTLASEREYKTTPSSSNPNQAQQGQITGTLQGQSSGMSGRPGSQGGGSAYATFIQRLYTQLERNKYYPMMARRMRIEGQVQVAFTVMRDGQIQDIRLVQASGSDVLNRAAIQSVEKASGHWPIPDHIPGPSLPLKISFNYQLN